MRLAPLQHSTTAGTVIRLLMAQAASNAGKDPREWGFTHTVQLWTEWGREGCRPLAMAGGYST
jgi:hypothetical protein